MEIDSAENSNWLFDYAIIDDISAVSTAAFPPPAAATAAVVTSFSWPSQAFDGSSDFSSEIDCSFGDSESLGLKEAGSRKRKSYLSTTKNPSKLGTLFRTLNVTDSILETSKTEVENIKLRPETCSAPGSKACREKLRRDRLNERFLELGSILEPGRPPKADKTAILSDAVRMVTELRSETQKLKESNEDLQEKIKELKAEKNELRDEKQRLKADKEKLELQVKAMSAQPGFMPHPPAMSAAFAAQGQTSGNKLMPFMGYPGVAMWQFMPPAVVDTSQDHVLRPPVA